MSLILNIESDAAKAVIHSAAKDWFDQEVKAGKIDPTTAAYIVEGSGDFAAYLVRRLLGGSK